MSGRLAGSLIYLSGPIDRAHDEGICWREQITPFLLANDIGVLNPCAKTTFEAIEDTTMRETISSLKEQEKWAEVSEIMKPIVFYDLRMVDLASCVIVYIDPDIYSCGTWDETFTAVAQQKPVLIICPKGIKYVPNWMFGRIKYDMMFTSIEGCISYLKKINSGEINPSYKKWKFFDFSKIFAKTGGR